MKFAELAAFLLTLEGDSFRDGEAPLQKESTVLPGGAKFVGRKNEGKTWRRSNPAKSQVNIDQLMITNNFAPAVSH